MPAKKDEMNTPHREILEHALGLNRSGAPYRNYFAAAEGSDDYAACVQLAALGLMRNGAPLPYGHYFIVTEKGMAALTPTPADERKE
jgi:hypothetical protein